MKLLLRSIFLAFLFGFLFLSPSGLMATETDEEVCPCGVDEDGECIPCPVEE